MPLTSLSNQQIPSTEAAVHLNTLYGGLGDQQRDFRNANLIRLICGYIQGSRVLDVGCGAGRLLNALKQEGFSPVGIEPDEELIALSERMNPELKIYQGEGDRLATIPEQFETITIIDVLEHIEDDVQQLELMYDRLEEGGRLVVVVPAHQWLYGQRDRNVGHFRRYSRKVLIERVQQTGFEVQSSRFWNMLGVAPYWFSERVLKKELNTSLRNDSQQGFLKRSLAAGLRTWFRGIENNVSFGFGLSVICIAQKPKSKSRQLRNAA